VSERGLRLLCVSDDAKPESESEMYISDVVRDGPETRALISIKRIRADELTHEHIGKFLGCHDPQAGANYGAKIMNVIRQEEHKNPGMRGTARSAARGLFAAAAAPRVQRRLKRGGGVAQAIRDPIGSRSVKCAGQR